jgi:hypothetical protein
VNARPLLVLGVRPARLSLATEALARGIVVGVLENFELPPRHKDTKKPNSEREIAEEMTIDVQNAFLFCGH